MNYTVTCLNGKWQFNESSVTPGSKLFTSSSSFPVPPGVTSLRLLLVGGGMGAPTGAGGAGGFVACGTVSVSTPSVISLVVGEGSSPGASGGTSSFGSYIEAGGAIFDSYPLQWLQRRDWIRRQIRLYNSCMLCVRLFVF